MKSIPLFFFVLFGLCTNAQQEASIWYFGRNAGLDFSTGVPTAITDGQTFTNEGTATISDSNGDLLFYTDGSTVWNRNHDIMPNGSGLNGDFSSTQSAIIIPLPENDTIYYVFTVDDGGEENGFQYTIVDITLDGGLGDVTTKNVLLTTPTAEKLTAVQHANNRDIWVLTHQYGTNNFLAYLVTPAGINTVPVTTAIGKEYPILEYGLGTRGYMKVSPDGSMVAIASFLHLELLKFDDTNGVFSDPIVLNDYYANRFNLDNFLLHYGVEFSPDSSKLYCSSDIREVFMPITYNITQFDISSYTTNDIQDSAVELVHKSNLRPGAMQLALDGKIYVSLDAKPSLGVINEPNTSGLACDYVENAIELNSGISVLGLPPFIQSYFLVGIEVENLCSGNGTSFEVNSSETIVSALWNFGDGVTSTEERPLHNYTTGGIYTVSVTVTTATNTKTETRVIVIDETPTAGTVADVTDCTEQQTYTVDVSAFDTPVLGTQDASVFETAYFLSQENADANLNPLDTVHEFALGTTPVFVRVSNTNNRDCYATTRFIVTARQSPVLPTLTDWTVCDDDTDGFYTFDLSLKNEEIFNGQDETNFEVRYFASQEDADAGSDALPFTYTNTLPMEELFVRFQNSNFPSCYSTGSFMIEVSSGVVANTPADLEACDDNNDGVAMFDLTETTPEIIVLQNPASLEVSYHRSMEEAASGANPLPTSYTNTTTYEQRIHVRVQNASDASCYATTFFTLRVSDTPQFQTVTDWTVCDTDTDGLSQFNLSEKNSEILGNQNGSNFTISYHETLAEAELGENEILGYYQNTSNPQLIYYKLESASNPDCFVTGSFQIEIFNTPFAIQPSAMIICASEELADQTIDLSQRTTEILGTQDPNQFNVDYYASELDAQNDSNRLDAKNYIVSLGEEIVYARVARINLQTCFATTPLELILNPLPNIPLEERYVICPDSPTLTIDGGDFETWSWQNGDGIELADTRTFNVDELGDYQLTVSIVQNGVRCENTAEFQVLSSGAPENMEVSVNGFSDQIALNITATGTGPFEYSVDGENYQTSNEFTVFPGAYIVYVRDVLECRILTKEINAIGYQRFFTPNGDGIHEYWNIIGTELYPEAQLYIFDRYGKFISQVDAASAGWDGTKNGTPLPESDYWFQYNYANDQVITGHFSLKR
ncbi:T9SS type B sorting domain-containing protein [Maribacter chungangensis]|uniref:T9SS type B sorting domain-containing protein n=1 Tax=Maribacter chungangensis TaxID=1069117 RepID=A0ABW3B356_9FLAO